MWNFGQGSYFDAAWSCWKDSVCFFNLSNRMRVWRSSWYCSSLVVDATPCLEEYTCPDACLSNLDLRLLQNAATWSWICTGIYDFIGDCSSPPRVKCDIFIYLSQGRGFCLPNVVERRATVSLLHLYIVTENYWKPQIWGNINLKEKDWNAKFF